MYVSVYMFRYSFLLTRLRNDAESQAVSRNSPDERCWVRGKRDTMGK